MNFQTLSKVENSKFYLDYAIKKAKLRASIYKIKLKTSDKFKKHKEVEHERFNTLRNALVDKFQHIIDSFPKIDALPIFYYELVKCTLDLDQLKKSLGSVKWVIRNIDKIYKIYNNKLRFADNDDQIGKIKKGVYGRISSIINQIDDYLIYIESCRRILKKFPTIKTSLKTIAIIGFPNVGKTTLLFKLTGSKPNIQNYAFTTKNINVSYLNAGNEKIQLLDTPGTLDRFKKMNPIEKQSFLAVKYLAQKIIYIFDLTESYPLESQERLFEKLKGQNKEIYIYLSKTDITEGKKESDFMSKYEKFTIFKSPEDLKKSVLEDVDRGIDLHE